MQHAPVALVPSQSAPAQNPSLPSCVHAGGCLPCDPSQTLRGAHPDVGGHPGSCGLGWAPAPLPAAKELACGLAGRPWAPSHSARPQAARGGPAGCARIPRSSPSPHSSSQYSACAAPPTPAGTRWHMAIRKNHTTSYTGKTGQPKFPKDRQVTRGTSASTDMMLGGSDLASNRQALDPSPSRLQY